MWLGDLCDNLNVDPKVKWRPSKFNLLKDFAKIPLHIIISHQADTKMYCSKHDQKSSNWLYVLVFNMMTVKLHDCVIPTNNEICSSQQDWITPIKLVLDRLFTCNVINALKNFLKINESKCLTHNQGKNISVITKQLHAAVVSLDEVNTFPDEAMEVSFMDLLRAVLKTSRQSFRPF